MLQRPAVAERLRRSSVEGPAVLWRERPFVLRQDDAVINGVFDRVVLHGNEKAPVSAEVIDFKTDAVDADDPAALEAFTAQYRVQMQSYRLALAEITSLDPQAISATLLLVGAGCAVSV
jgi:ATP-dependent exoDNAse (exonuclease V) beta subunit